MVGTVRYGRKSYADFCRFWFPTSKNKKQPRAFIIRNVTNDRISNNIITHGVRAWYGLIGREVARKLIQILVLGNRYYAISVTLFFFFLSQQLTQYGSSRLIHQSITIMVAGRVAPRHASSPQGCGGGVLPIWRAQWEVSLSSVAAGSRPLVHLVSLCCLQTGFLYSRGGNVTCN